MKIISEGRYPERFFIDPQDGAWNTLDITIVILGWAFASSSDSSSIGVLRLLRLVRLLTFVKGVPQLKIIVAGLFEGLKSVAYILILLALVIYISSIMSVLFFGLNDPARFGNVPIAMVSLFQVKSSIKTPLQMLFCLRIWLPYSWSPRSHCLPTMPQITTGASWTGIVYTSFFGCNDYTGSPYSGENPSKIHTVAGSFQGFRCDVDEPNAGVASFFFPIYLILTGKKSSS